MYGKSLVKRSIACVLSLSLTLGAIGTPIVASASEQKNY